MSSFGEVFVQNNRYRLKGTFHHLAPNRPIHDGDAGWKLLGITNPRDLTYIHSYGGEAIFFESLGKGVLLATRCKQQGCTSKDTVYLPFRIHCPDCLERNTIIDITDSARKSARIYTYMVCERSGAFSLLDKPIRFINVEFEGVDTILMSYLSIGEPALGMRVVPIFRTREPTCTILDLSWVPEETSPELLPEGFSFQT